MNSERRRTSGRSASTAEYLTIRKIQTQKSRIGEPPRLAKTLHNLIPELLNYIHQLTTAPGHRGQEKGKKETEQLLTSG